MRRVAALLVCSFSILTTASDSWAGCPSCQRQCDCNLAAPPRHGPLIQIFGNCHHHGCRHGCHHDRDDRGSRDAQPAFSRSVPMAPSGPIVESYPMMRAMPTMMAMPMMVGTQVRGYDDRAADPCESRFKDRMDSLDERVDALDLRMETIQRAVEIQTRILEELKAQGTIGNQPVPIKAAADQD